MKSGTLPDRAGHERVEFAEVTFFPISSGAPGGRRAKSVAVAILWLLLASAFVATVGPRSPPASGFQEAGQFASTVIGQANFTSQSSSLASASLNRPFRSGFDGSGDLWVADENDHRVVEFKPPFTDGESASVEIGQPSFGVTTTTPANVTVASQASLYGPVSVAFDSSGDLWVSDFVDNRVTEYVPPFTSGMNASLELGQPAGDLQFMTHTPRPPNNGLAAPLDLAFDPSGDLWVADRGNNRVVEYARPFIDGESPSVVVGQDFLNASVGATTRSGLHSPESIAFDAAGNLWVVDQVNNRVLEFASSSLKGNGPQAVLEIGQRAGQEQFLSNESGRSQSALNAPVGVAFDSSGDLLVSDRANNRILGFSPPFTDGMNASFEIGQPGGTGQFTTGVSSTSQDNLDNPLGIAVDARGDLWVADQLNGRLLEFSGDAAATSGEDAIVSQGAAAVNEPSTGVSVGMKGIASGSLVNFYTSDLERQPPGTGSPGLNAPGSYSAFYEVEASDASGSAATVCIANTHVTGSTDLRLYADGVWYEASAVNRTQGVSICGDLPPPELHSLLLLAIGGPSSASSSPSSWPLGALVAVAAVVLAGVTFVVLKRRSPRY